VGHALKPDFLQRTFQLTKGVGPYREKELWAQGLSTWEQFEQATRVKSVMSARLDKELLYAIEQCRTALASADPLTELAHLVPAKEHWRLYAHFPKCACFFDIEADGDNVPTVVGLMDDEGLATFRRGHSLRQLPVRLAQSPMWVTFNGAVFDVPVLRKAFVDQPFPTPAVHLDLRFLVRRTHLKGGLKGIEETLKLHRPPHLKGIRGLDAIHMWRLYNANRDLKALRILTEYNLYDAINLRSVLEWCQWRIADLSAWDVERQPIFERGEVLYDLSKLLLSC
jgi:uncharacterized protein